MELSPIRSAGQAPRASEPARPDPEARRAMDTARAFEAAFLAEMLKHSGINAMPTGFGGGAGEDAFSSFLTGEYARLMSERGGIGLAERIFASLMHGKTPE
jgi:peptidoglycan hydrolase FlgJ